MGGAIRGPLLFAATLFLVISPALCHAQTFNCPIETITSITPDTLHAGKTFDVVVAGTNLDCIGPGILVKADGTPAPLNIIGGDYYSSPSTMLLTIQVDAGAPTETDYYTVINSCATADDDPCPDGQDHEVFWSVSFPIHIVGCPPPTITSIKPSTWFAGKTYNNVVIRGTDFITPDKATDACPATQVSIITADEGWTVPVTGVTVESKTKITLTVAPDGSSHTQQATVIVGTAPNTTSATAQILGNQIKCDPSMGCNQDVISTTDGSDPPAQNVVVGQPIKLITPDLPSGISATKTIWTVGGTNIGGYILAPDFSSASVAQTVLKNPTLNTYWVYPRNAIPVTYKYCVDIPGTDADGKCSLVANASFNVSGPTATITPNPTSWSVSRQMSCPTLIQLLYFGYPDPTSGCSHIPLVKGISFRASLSNVPGDGGTAEWVQLITKDNLTGTLLSGGKAGPTSLGVGLDNTYPYRPDDPNAVVTTAASDSPNNDLDPALARETRRFKANMYYMWKSQIPGSIFVPLGYVAWSTSGTAVQHTEDTPPWSLDSDSSGPTTAVFKPSSDTGNSHGYPAWSGIALNSQSNGNENGDEGGELEEQQ